MDSLRRWQPWLLSLLILLTACEEKKPPKAVIRAYYYWRTSGEISDSETEYIRQHQLKRIYVRLMDVDWKEIQGAVPVSKTNIENLNHSLNKDQSLSIEIVPVVFITNKVFEKTNYTDIDLLATRLARRFLPAFDATDIAWENQRPFQQVKPKEIQIDCDWTSSTSAKYFSFLNSLKSKMPAGVKLSVTIRLHQYKYPEKTGVPPVDRGMLMIYNLSDPKQYNASNSIFDYEKASKYFSTTKKYKLPLDMALPAFSWSIIFRNGIFYTIENALSEQELREQSFLVKNKNGFYAVRQDTVFHELFLRPGDEIKPEGITNEQLLQAVTLAQKAINTDSFCVAPFELSESEIKNFSSETIDKVYNSYR